MTTLWRSFFGGLANVLRSDPLTGAVLLAAFVTITYYMGGNGV